jgi:hypothetical protein
VPEAVQQRRSGLIELEFGVKHEVEERWHERPGDLSRPIMMAVAAE